jgi:hypothetical protein
MTRLNKPEITMMNKQKFNRKQKHWSSVLALIGVIGGLALVSDDGLIPVANAQDDLVYVPLASPCRVVNTRNTDSTHLIAADSRDFFSFGSAGTIVDQGGNPAGCDHPRSSEVGIQPAAIAANVTAVGKKGSGNGNISAYPAGSVAPSASTVNYTPAANIANSTLITLRTSDGSFTLLSSNANVPAIIDVVGYFYPIQGGEQQVDCSIDANALLNTTIKDDTTFYITGACNGPIYVASDGVHLIGAEPNRAASIVLPNPTLDPSIGAVFVDGGQDVRIENLLLDASAWAGAGAEGSDAGGLYIRSAFVRLIDSKVVGGLWGVNPFRDALLRMEGTNDITGFVNAGISVGDQSTLTARGQVNVSTTNTAASVFTSGGYTSAIETYRQGVIDFRAGLTVSVPADIPGSDYYPGAISVSGQSIVRVKKSGTVTIQGHVSAYQQSTLNISGGTFNGGLAAYLQSHISINIDSGTIDSSGAQSFVVDAQEGSVLKITGGTIVGTIFAQENSALNLDDVALSDGAIELFRSSMIKVSSSTLDFSNGDTITADFGSHISLTDTTLTAGPSAMRLHRFSTLELEGTTDLGSIGISCSGESFDLYVADSGATNLGDTSNCP